MMMMAMMLLMMMMMVMMMADGDDDNDENDDNDDNDDNENYELYKAIANDDTQRAMEFQRSLIGYYQFDEESARQAAGFSASLRNTEAARTFFRERGTRSARCQNLSAVSSSLYCQRSRQPHCSQGITGG